MKRKLSYYYYLFYFLAAIISCLVIDSISVTPVSDNTYITSPITSKELIGQPMADKPAAPVNTDSLKTSDWYQTVTADIARKNYYIAAESNGRAGSNNPGQAMKTTFTPDGFTLSEMEDLSPGPILNEQQPKKNKDSHWQLSLMLKGLYADETLVCKPDNEAIMRADSNELMYTHHDLLQVQYQNTEAGLRQNFIIEKAPAGNVKVLRIAMYTGSEWVMNKVNDSEIHFAQQSKKNEGKTKVIYKELKVWDADERVLEARMETNNNEISIIVNAEEAKYPVTIDPLSTTAATTLAGPSANSNFGFSVASAGDVNGDGYSDIVVGAPAISSNTGAAYIYHGSSTGIATTAATTINGSASNDNFGWSVASAGDVNRDGYSDVIIGAKGFNFNSGRAYIYHGSALGISTPAITLSMPDLPSGNSYFGNSVASAGDVNGDGYSDVIIGAYGFNSNEGRIYIYHGGSAGVSSIPSATRIGPGSGSNFGYSVATAGDVNGDGFSDVIFGAYGISTNDGRAYIYQGGASGISAGISTTLSNAPVIDGSFGFSVAAAGDVNGDGYSDVIVGAYTMAASTGAAYIFHGGSAGVSTTIAATLNGPVSPSHFGYSVASAGDVNGDGYSDIVVGANRISGNTGAAYIYEGGSSGVSTTVAATLNGAANLNYFGNSVAAAGDVNGDGYSDVIVGAYGFTTNTGAAYIYHGSSSGLSANALASFTAPVSASNFGTSVASAGDVNGDGYNDVIVGAPLVSSNTGAAYIYLGSQNGISITASATLSGSIASGYFGLVVALAGDVNGDGYSDVMVGAPFALTSVGRAYIYHGNSSGISTTPATTLSGVGPNNFFGNNIATAGDVNGDGYSDVIVGAWGVSSNTGAAYVFHGGPSGISNTPAITLSGSASGNFFGRGVASAGDVNGDGYSDVIIGATGAASNFGTASVYYGSNSGVHAAAVTTLTGPASNSSFGFSVSSAGDVNGDGKSDVIVGAYGVSLNTGAVYVYHGGSAGVSTLAATVCSGTAGDFLGISVASVGDINGDGYCDIAGGAYGFSGGMGGAFIYQGSETGIINIAATSLTGPAVASRFGWSLAGAGDVNGDGYSDLIVGAYNFSTGTGSAYLYAGNGGYNKRNNTLRLYEMDLAAPYRRTNWLAPQFGIGLYVRPFAGGIKARLVWETEPNSTGFMHNSPITNYTGYTAAQLTFTTIPPAGIELKTLVTKNGAATKLRVRVQYQSTLLPGGQVFGPWIYPQQYLLTGQTNILSGVILPVKFSAISAHEKQSGVQIDWTVHEEQNLSHYVVEHSANGMSFSSIGTVAAQNTGNQTSYGFFDAHPFAGINFYRIRSVDFDGKTGYSHIVRVNLDKTDAQITLYPNPVRNGYISIQSSNLAKGMYTANLLNAAGQLIHTWQFTHAGGSINQTFNLPAGMNAGMYVLSLESEKIKIFNRTVFIE